MKHIRKKCYRTSRSLSVILIAVAPRRPWHMLSPIARWKQLILSGTSIISAIIAKLCWTSFISSSIILINVCISNNILLAGIVMLIVPLEKSVSDEQTHRKSSSQSIALAILPLVDSYCQKTGAEIIKRIITGVEGVPHYHMAVNTLTLNLAQLHITH